MNRETWLQMRKTYIGGSDIGCILGLSKYKSALDIYLEKTTDVIEEATSEAAHWGKMLEDAVTEEYTERTGLSVHKPQGLIRHPKYNFLAANIDRWVDGENGKRHILECKTANFMKSKEWGIEGTDQIPELYLCQAAYYAAICDVEKVDIAVLIGGQDFRIYTYISNKEFEDKLILAACTFWNNFIARRIAPQAGNLDDIATLYPKSNGLKIEANSVISKKINELRSLKEQERSLSKKIESLQFEIKDFMKDNEVLTGNNGTIEATWKNGQPRMFLDSGRLKSEHQAIYQQYLKERKPVRTFLIK